MESTQMRVLLASMKAKIAEKAKLDQHAVGVAGVSGVAGEVSLVFDKDGGVAVYQEDIGKKASRRVFVGGLWQGVAEYTEIVGTFEMATAQPTGR